MMAGKERKVVLWSIGAALAFLLCIWKAPGVSTLLLASFILAYVTAPAVDRVARIVPRALASVLVLLGMGLLFVGMLLLLVPVLAAQWQNVSERLPHAVNYAQDTVVPWVEAKFGVQIPHSGSDLAERLRTHLTSLGSTIAAPLGQFMAKTFGGVIGLAGAVANLILIPVIAFYLLRDYHAIWPRYESMVPRRSVARVRALRVELDSALSGFVRGQLTVAVILGTLYAIGLSIVGIDGSVVIGLLSGFLNMVPYVGTTLGISLALLMAVLSFSGWTPILGVVIVFVIANTLEGMVITPRIVGDKTGLSPVSVMLSILAGGEVFGFAGLLLGVPAAAVLKVLLGVVREAYFRSDAYLAGMPAAGMAAAPVDGPDKHGPPQDLRDPAPKLTPRPKPGAGDAPPPHKPPRSG